MKKNTLFIISIFVFCSCGARKTETEKKEESTKQELSGIFRNSGNSEEILNSDLNSTFSNQTKSNDQSLNNTDEFIVEPCDPTKPAAYIDPNGHKHILDNAKLTNKKSTIKTDKKTENSQNSEEFLKQNQHKKLENENSVDIKKAQEKKITDKKKKTDREQWSLWNILWFLIPVLIWKIYKKVNPIS